jgi:hypothetical protein
VTRPVFHNPEELFTITVPMNSTGASQRLLSATHIAKSFGFDLSFSCQKRNPKDFATS